MEQIPCDNDNFYENIGILFPVVDVRLKGRLFREPEDFIVMETHQDGRICSITSDPQT